MHFASLDPMFLTAQWEMSWPRHKEHGEGISLLCSERVYLSDSTLQTFSKVIKFINWTTQNTIVELFIKEPFINVRQIFPLHVWKQVKRRHPASQQFIPDKGCLPDVFRETISFAYSNLCCDLQALYSNVLRGSGSCAELSHYFNLNPTWINGLPAA